MEELPARKNNRLKDYDYSSAGYYFVTICTNNQQNILSSVCRGDPCGRPESELTELGEICATTFEIIEATHNVSILKYVIMPNHIHMIISNDADMRATARVAPTIGSVIGSYKSMVSNSWLVKCKEHGIHMGQIWQRNYHDHIIRGEADYQRICQYIDENLERWTEDEYYTK